MSRYFIDHMRTVLFILICASLLGCSHQRRPGGGLIQSAGEFAPPEQEWHIRVAKDGQFEVQLSPKVAKRFDWKPQAGWFLYIEDAEHLWSFDGAGEFYVYVWTENGSIGRYDMPHYRGVIPATVLEALPTAVHERVRRHLG